MTQFFQAHVAIDLQMNDEGLERYANLSQAGFSENKYILLQTALAHYHARGVHALKILVMFYSRDQGFQNVLVNGDIKTYL